MASVTLPGEFEVTGLKVRLDEDGFLENPEVWNDDVALWLAKNLLGLPTLSETHWKLVRYLHQYWATHGVCPPIKMVTKATGITYEEMYDLFPEGPGHGACRVAGARCEETCRGEDRL